MLEQPLPLHVQGLLGAASQIPEVAKAFVNGFDHPPALFPWIASPEASERFIAAGGVPSPDHQAVLS
jgi:hypothetical protein